jgi:hypothetical protein
MSAAGLRSLLPTNEIRERLFRAKCCSMLSPRRQEIIIGLGGWLHDSGFGLARAGFASSA